MAASLVIRSVPDTPVSCASARVGVAGARLSKVKLNDVAEETLPATSVSRTNIVLEPCTSARAAVVQCVVPSAEYSMSAPGSEPVKASVPLLVILSVLEMPVSNARATDGADTSVSSVKSKVATADKLPATSVCRISTEFAPSTAVNELVQCAP